MSRNTFPFSFRATFFLCAVLALAVSGLVPATAVAQGFTQSEITFPIVGHPNLRVNASGGLTQQMGGQACPFFDMDLKKIETAFIAAKSRDPDSCPHADGGDENIYFAQCGGVYRAWAQMAAGVLAPEMNMSLLGCEFPPGPERDSVRNRAKALSARTDVYLGYVSKLSNIMPARPGIWSKDDMEKYNQQKQQEVEANQQCLDDTLQRVAEYWAQKRGVSCIRYVTGAVKTLMTTNIRDLKDSLLTKTSIGSASTMTYGAMTAVVSAPSLWGLANVVASAANFASEVISLASEVSDMLNTLSEECGNLVPQLRELQQWRKTNADGICRAVSNLIERQLTQCIRVNISGGAVLSLPQFRVAMQCPVRINMAARLTPRGFDCFGNVAAGSPVIGTGRGGSLLGGNGGLENLFDGKCFKSPAQPAQSACGGFGTCEEDRVAGVDCGPLDPDQRKQINLQGRGVWVPGRTTNGWAAGRVLATKVDAQGNKTVVPEASEKLDGLLISRCDYYEGGKSVRTAYVFGDPSSCRDGKNGFLAGGYETNTSCYGGYTPAPKPAIPDACMYDAACLNARGDLDESRIGSGSCSGHGALPIFNASRTYRKFASGGFGGGDMVENSCRDYDGEVSMPVVCCDPQKQDCRNADPGTPLCQCDQGSANNKVKLNLATMQPDANGYCEEGGRVTCCSPRLNGGKEICAQWNISLKQKNLPELPLCPSEMVDQCIPMDEKATVRGPDGRAVTQTPDGKAPLTIGATANSKPSPYLYLFVRPDVTTESGLQCCSTEWCNLCPQHYANAYGLSLRRDKPILDAGGKLSDQSNRILITNGWPYRVKDSTQGGTLVPNDFTMEYLVGVREYGMLTVKIDSPISQERQISSANVPLHVSDKLKMPLSVDACNRASVLKMQVVPSKQFGDGYSMDQPVMGWTYSPNLWAGSNAKWEVHGPVPEPTEYPIDYLNRMNRNTADSTGVSLPPIQLCSEVKMCLPETAGTVLPKSLTENRGGIRRFNDQPTTMLNNSMLGIGATGLSFDSGNTPPPRTGSMVPTVTGGAQPTGPVTGLTGTTTPSTTTPTTRVPTSTGTATQSTGTRQTGGVSSVVPLPSAPSPTTPRYNQQQPTGTATTRAPGATVVPSVQGGGVSSGTAAPVGSGVRGSGAASQSPSGVGLY